MDAAKAERRKGRTSIILIIQKNEEVIMAIIYISSGVLFDKGKSFSSSYIVNTS